MRVVIDIECDKLVNPTKIWVVVCKDIDTNQYHIFREKDDEAFREFSSRVSCWIGHNVLQYDFPVLARLWNYQLRDFSVHGVVDTLILSRLVDYSRTSGHSIESYGSQFGLSKGKFTDFSHYSLEMEEYCVRDVDICHAIATYYGHIINDSSWASAIELENRFQLVCNRLHDNGFSFNSNAAQRLLDDVTKTIKELDDEILRVFVPKPRPVRTITPKLTKYGTLSKTDFRWIRDGDLSSYSAGASFTRISWHTFNPASHKQIVDVLKDAGWQPTDRTQAHINLQREVDRQKHWRRDKREVDLSELSAKLDNAKVYGWKVNENNLSTLPSTAPSPARTLAKRILFESRRRSLKEWLGLVNPDTGRIHGSFQGIGAWTHRMAHQKPNTANIPNDLKEDGTKKLLGKELRSLWQAPRNRLLAGVDAEGIQLRIFAHYIDDEEFTDALVRGKKSNKTDPHSLNQKILGSVCKTRQVAKRFIYALLLGAGLVKLVQILETSETDTRKALDRLLERYTGFRFLKDKIIPKDAEQGFLVGLDGRQIRIPGETVFQRKHLAMSGYLQSGEAIVMKRATLLFEERLPEYDSFLVDLVHDEWQTETPKALDTAKEVCELECDCLYKAGVFYKLKCPMQGSYWNDDKKDYTIGTNWYKTH